MLHTIRMLVMIFAMLNRCPHFNKDFIIANFLIPYFRHQYYRLLMPWDNGVDKKAHINSIAPTNLKKPMPPTHLSEVRSLGLFVKLEFVSSFLEPFTFLIKTESYFGYNQWL